MSQDTTITDLWAATYDADQLAETDIKTTFRADFEDDEPTLEWPDKPKEPVILGALIGKGGAANVYTARQGALSREVAVKKIRRAERLHLVRRFSHEARITAGLNHPNILPIHDLITLDGQPALVMKRVTGQSWSEHLAEVHAAGTFDLATEIERLLPVCEAIEFAHSRGVLHLDIKAANVMVGDYGEVLVMDWGCATVFSEAHWKDQPFLPRAQRVRKPFGSPAYMAPEQARGNGESFGPATDVYLIGALLQYVLTQRDLRIEDTIEDAVEAAARGVRIPVPDTAPPQLAALCRKATEPVPADRLQSVAAFRTGLTEWLNTREARELTQRAVDSLNRLEAYPTLTPADRNEGVRLLGVFEQAGRLGTGLPEAIAAEQRTRLFLANAALGQGEVGLARTLMNPLEASDPVVAEVNKRADGLAAEQAALQTQTRWFRRGLWVSGLLLLGALAGVSTLWQRAETERERAEAVKTFSQNMLRSMKPDEAQGLDNQLMLKVLQNAERDAEEAYADQPDLHAEVLQAVVESYRALGLWKQALDLNERLIHLLQTVHGSDDLRVARAQLASLALRERLGNLDEAERSALDLLDALEKRKPNEHGLIFGVQTALADVYVEQGRYTDAIGLAIEVHDRALEVGGPDHKWSLEAQRTLLNAYLRAERFEEAEPLALELLELDTRQHGPEDRTTVASQRALASVHLGFDRYPEAERLLVAALASEERTMSPDHPAVLASVNSLANVYAAQQKFAEAERMHRRSVDANTRTLGPQHPRTLISQFNLAMNHSRAGRMNEAEDLMDEVLQSRVEVLGTEHPKTMKTALTLGQMLEKQGKQDAALQLFRDVVERFQLTTPTTYNRLYAVSSFVRLLRQRDRSTEAAAFLREALPPIQQAMRTTTLEPRAVLVGVGLESTYAELINPTEGEAFLAEALADAQRMQSPNVQLVNWRLQRLSNAYCAHGKLEACLEVRKEAVAWAEKHVGPTHKDTLINQFNLGLVHQRLEQHTEAVAVFASIIEGRSSTLGPDHPKTLKAHLAQAQSHTKLNHNALAEQGYTRALTGYRQVEPLDEMWVLTARIYADFLQESGRTADAQQLRRSVIAEAQERLGDTAGSAAVQQHLSGLEANLTSETVKP